MTELKGFREFLMKDRSSNMNKLFIQSESQFKELLQTTMPLKLKFNIFLNKFKRLLLNMNQFKGLGKESNIYQLKPRLFTTLKEKNM